MSKRDPLLKAHVGKEQCSTWRGPNGKDLKLCVKGSTYGFSAWLHGSGGTKVPVSTGDARTAREAMTNAKASLERVATKRN